MIVKVKGIAYDMSGSPIILLTDPTEQKVLPIWIGLLEAHSIAVALEEFPPPRPMTHDITLTICRTLGAEVTRVEITQIKDNTFFAELYLSTENDDFLIDVRPSDAIALAIRAEVPINISEALQEQMIDIKQIFDEETQQEMDKLLEEYKKSLH
ncbi:bifunctional nuclease family protein [Desulfotruncus alcoholivorax]|uniref:bifunctional nuclease family protein n=1 Tax=Desulfotruncus alcoholivorax TaxID=265477 RepID=UPI00041A3392|nr:bifunctional nuclease family protein [Desulfotruncus alcoholivorax]